MVACIERDRKKDVDLDGDHDDFSADAHAVRWKASDQSLLSATLLATPTQRIAWLEEALQLAYATGALKPKRFLSKEGWDGLLTRVSE